MGIGLSIVCDGCGAVGRFQRMYSTDLLAKEAESMKDILSSWGWLVDVLDGKGAYCPACKKILQKQNNREEAIEVPSETNDLPAIDHHPYRPHSHEHPYRKS